MYQSQTGSFSNNPFLQGNRNFSGRFYTEPYDIPHAEAADPPKQITIHIIAHTHGELMESCMAIFDDLMGEFFPQQLALAC